MKHVKFIEMKIGNKTDLKRKLVEYMLLLKRDSKKFNFDMFLLIDELLVIGYSFEKDCWLLNNEDWNPSVEEAANIVDDYSSIAISEWINAFENYRDYVNEISSNDTCK